MARQAGKKGVLQGIMFYGAFLLYLVILAALLFAKNDSAQSYNLIPLHTLLDYISNDKPLALSNTLGNLILFLPMGVYLPLLCRRQGFWRQFLWLTIICIAVEVLQYVFCLGVADIDDVLLNCLGGLLGIGLYHLLSLIFQEKVRSVVVLLSLIAGAIFLAVIYCLWSGVFGIRAVPVPSALRDARCQNASPTGLTFFSWFDEE